MSTPGDDDLTALLRRLSADDAFDRQEAMAQLGRLAPERLAGLANHPVDAVRRGLATVICGRDEPELVAAVRTLAADRALDVRVAVAQALERLPDWDPGAELLRTLAASREDVASLPALRRMEGRTDCLDTIIKVARDDEASWDMQKEATRLLAFFPDGEVALGATLETIAGTTLEAIAQGCAAHLEKRLEKGELDGVQIHPGPLTSKAVRVIRGWSERTTPRLEELLGRSVPPEADADALGRFGRDLTAEARAGALPRAFETTDEVELIERTLEADGGGSLVLLGPNGAGKSGLVTELCHRLVARDGAPWTVVRITPSELLVGTKYLGEWQTKVKELIDLSVRPQRVILFIPGLPELLDVGTSSGNESMSAATLLAPHIESGALRVIGETTPDAWAAAGAGAPSWQRLFQPMDVRPASRERTAEILRLVAAEADADVRPEAVEAALDVAEVYMAETALPGRAVDLFRRMLAGEPAGDAYGRPDVLRTLEEATGVPPDFLDDAIPLEQERVRAFLESRVMGQPRAVEQMLDLVTLVKAGLDAPTKPSGVLLFVGPTGVGKTELSRALAELLFGDPGRLVRFDMSEYASYESYERLIGTPRRDGVLTGAVRREPFSVVLLDEIEKAHRNVFDLCLQIFDAGRLTDGAGRTVRFTKSIVILTSNLGSAVRTESGIGFDGSAPPPPTAEEIDKALRDFFRPKFLGRIDQVVVFDALSPETAARIARREARSMLRRGGLTRRRVTVDVDDAVYAHILRTGYSPALGARPLKRAVETVLLMPVARILAAGEARAGACIRLEMRGGKVHATVQNPEAEPAAMPKVAPDPGLDEIIERAGALRARAELMDARRGELLAETLEPGFWDGGVRATARLDELHRLEEVLTRFERLEAEVETTRGNRGGARLGHFLDRHRRALGRLEILLDEDVPVCDAYLRVSAVGAPGAGLDGVERLARMYAGWGRRSGMEVEVLDDRPAGPESEDTAALLIGGAGAFALLRRDAGLHRLQHVLGKGSSVTSLVRVDVLPADPAARAGFEAELDVECRPLTGVTGRLVAALRSDVHLLHRPSMTSLRAACPLAPDEAAAPLIGLLAALREDRASTSFDVVRRYRFGRSPIVKDVRSGRTTGRVDRVFAGDLHLVTDA